MIAAREGWYAAYADKDGDLFTEDVIAWQQNHGLEGLITPDLGGKVIEVSKACSEPVVKFLGYITPSDNDQWWRAQAVSQIAYQKRLFELLGTPGWSKLVIFPSSRVKRLETEGKEVFVMARDSISDNVLVIENIDDEFARSTNDYVSEIWDPRLACLIMEPLEFFMTLSQKMIFHVDKQNRLVPLGDWIINNTETVTCEEIMEDINSMTPLDCLNATEDKENHRYVFEIESIFDKKETLNIIKKSFYDTIVDNWIFVSIPDENSDDMANLF